MINAMFVKQVTDESHNEPIQVRAPMRWHRGRRVGKASLRDAVVKFAVALPNSGPPSEHSEYRAYGSGGRGDGFPMQLLCMTMSVTTLIGWAIAHRGWLSLMRRSNPSSTNR